MTVVSQATNHYRRKRAVLARDGGCCVWCGSRCALTLHHIRSRSLGGSDRGSNLLVLCRPCHDRVEHFAVRVSALTVWLGCGPVLWLARTLRAHR